MPEYRRKYIPGGIYFFSVVTFGRKPILLGRSARELFFTAWLDTRRRFPFRTEACCLLPDHVHCIWKLPEHDSDFSMRWKEIKRLFTKGYLAGKGTDGFRNPSRVRKGEAAVWQRRFWEHSIRDQEDLNRHIAYIHYNPVKHGLVKRARDWPWSSFHRYVAAGLIDADWGGVDLNFEAGE